MKIVLVIDQFDDSNNGTTVTARRFAGQLRRRGHEVVILAGGAPCEGKICAPVHRIPAVSYTHLAGLPQGRAKACSRNGSNCTSGAFGGTMYKYQCAKMRKSHACGA